MKKKDKMNRILPALIVVLAAVAVMNQYVIMTPPTGMATYQPLRLVDYSENGYQQLLRYDSGISLDSAQMENYNGLDVEMPCCGFKTLQAMGNCGCGHHIALSGLAKFMASNGYSRAEIQDEIDVWKEVFYPGGTPGVGSGAMGSC